MKTLHFLLFLGFFLFTLQSNAQSLRINEVSQGPSGSQEYVELVVIGPSITSCAESPSCVDLRGWIFDDNNGNFSGGPSSGVGIATGAMRFSNAAFWSCIYPGTLIVIYNDSDPNSSMPAQDLSTTDQNCKLVTPANSNLFERNEVQPNNTTAAYATTGWISGGDWNTIGMANGGDSFQIFAPGNTTTPVHAVSFGNNDQNNQIYFAGSGSGMVISNLNTTSNDPYLQANWVSQAAASNQTPGAANSTQNSTFIISMNPTCSSTPISQLSVSANVTQASCGSNCDGGISLTISGGTAPYTVNWSNGSTENSLSSLCAGNYVATITDATGCQSQSSTQITNSLSGNLQVSADVSICLGEITTLTATGATSYSWDNGLGNGSSFDVSPPQTTTYTVTGTDNGCSSTASVTVSVLNADAVFAGEDVILCFGENYTLNATGASNYLWSSGQANGETFTPNLGLTVLTVIASAGNCTASDQVSILVNNCFWELEMPNVVTPNNDQINDFFEPVLISGIELKSLQLLNRWGNTIYETSQLPIKWDVQLNGQTLSEGTYFYRIQFKTNAGESLEKHGFFEVKK